MTQIQMPAPTKEQLAQWDAEDPLKWTRDEFEIPSAKACGADVDGEAIYFCGNSLGLLSKRARKHVEEELDTWSTSAVTGHFEHKYGRPWKYVDESLLPGLAKILGAKVSECAHTSTLTSNIHNLFSTFYNPTPKRWKIMIEKGSFPSDWYAIHSHPRLHAGVLSPEQIENAVIAVEPREGEDHFRMEDIVKLIEENKDELAIVWMPIIQYWSGQLFDAELLSRKAHEAGALFGLDLAHGTGNVILELDKWGVDLAVWCTYKYLNAGPGATGGFFIREGLEKVGAERRLAGWWGNDPRSRFEMKPEFEPTAGARGFQHSCTTAFGSIPLLGTLEIIDKADFPTVHAKGERLNAALDALLRTSPFFLETPPADGKVGFRIITPAAPWRGAQISIFLHGREGIMPRVFHRMIKLGFVGDERHPNVIRLSAAPLYNTFTEVGKCVDILNAALQEEK